MSNSQLHKQHQDLLWRLNELQIPLIAAEQTLSLLCQDPKLGESAAASIVSLRINNQRLLMMIDNLLELSHYDNSTKHFQFRSLNLAELIGQVADEMLPIAQAKSLPFKQELSNVYVFGDRTNLRRAIRNLIDNAIKFTHFGQVVVECRQDSDQALFVVRDTGCGIAPHNHSSIFERYRQAHHLQQVGSGVGLFLVRQIVNRHGGSIGVSSQTGKGSTFTVFLPAVPTPDS
ncbi:MULTISPECIES: sensor histidine kinase [unclassified Coleofasciculus]|uniref:sensor histidine kinase n=1 Tax=unclassified Coleofasciculus TaxID=2692782 RepID=UPI001881E2C2|nr:MULTISPECIES: HAMP domain-containing sensor histidine kinase [unclassified Coleofasciculus]MBE9124736.1 HAMP domain-containing histidine kinase [Coleofasciculus sp. LEGE 07081]MBE9148188.1 HAMP domain-containing histidine kinase [Coleofasciculus sp. LEGE 07092]